MYDYKFDESYLKEVITKGEELLNNKNLSNKKRKRIEFDIKTFKRFIIGNYEQLSEEIPSYDELTFTKLKNLFLKGAEEHYNFFKEPFINYIIDLYHEHIFRINNYYSEKVIPFDEQIYLTLKNYDSISPRLYEEAKKIIFNDSFSQIQLVDDLDISSYCHFSDISNCSFLIIDSKESNNLFNHEIEHAVEDSLKVKQPNAYLELGSITTELLFNDVLFKEKNYLCSDDVDRIEDTNLYLKDLVNYFKLLKKLAKYDFKVNNSDFMKISSKVMHIPEGGIERWLCYTLENCDYDLELCYLISFLKAVELRECVVNTKCDILELLNKYYVGMFNFEIPKDGFEVYKRYVKEMNDKIRK